MKFKKSSLLLKLVVVAVVLYAGVTLMSLTGQVQEMEAQKEEKEAALVLAQQRNARMEDDIENVDSKEAVEDIARDQLGLVAPGETVFYDVGN